jgi:tetratricopeptide (TPR) repeat protein
MGAAAARDERLLEARAAFAAADWQTAKELYRLLLAADPDDPDALDGLGQSLWWLAEKEAGMELRAKAFVGYQRRGDNERAGFIVQQALTSLEAARVVSAMTVGTEQRYSIDRARWGDFLGLSPLPAQRDWPQLLGALRRILRWLEQEDLDEMSPYMRASRARDLLEDVHLDLAYAGIPVEFGRTPEEAWEALAETIEWTLERWRERLGRDGTPEPWGACPSPPSS